MLPAPLAVIVTAVFVVTGGYALLRLSTLATRRRIAADPLTDVSHVLMSAAMVAMTLGWASTVADGMQIVVFGLLAAVFVGRTRQRSRPRRRRMELGAHAVMVAAMVWMVISMAATVAAFPVTGVPSSPSAADHALHEAAHAPDWVITGNVAFIAALVGVVLVWVRHVRRPGSGTPTAGTPTMTTLLTRYGPECHILMAAGMGVMLLAMT